MIDVRQAIVILPQPPKGWLESIQITHSGVMYRLKNTKGHTQWWDEIIPFFAVILSIHSDSKISFLLCTKISFLIYCFLLIAIFPADLNPTTKKHSERSSLAGTATFRNEISNIFQLEGALTLNIVSIYGIWTGKMNCRWHRPKATLKSELHQPASCWDRWRS